MPPEPQDPRTVDGAAAEADGVPEPGVLVVDAANVVGARPDGWWTDRAGAAERLVAGLAAAVAGRVDPALTARRVIVVLEGRAVTAVTAGAEADGLEVVRAPRDGDATVVDLVASHQGRDVLVVTSDRGLRRRVEELGATTVGAGRLRDVLDRV